MSHIKNELYRDYISTEKLGNFSLNFIVIEIMLFSGLIPGANIYSFIIYIEAKMLWSNVNLFENLVVVNKYLFISTQIHFEKWDTRRWASIFYLSEIFIAEYVISMLYVIFGNNQIELVSIKKLTIFVITESTKQFTHNSHYHITIVQSSIQNDIKQIQYISNLI